MTQELIAAAAIGSLITWLVSRFLVKTVGTRYRTERDCKDCETRHAVQEIKTLVTELAIKAGVPAHEVGRFVASVGSRRSTERE